MSCKHGHSNLYERCPECKREQEKSSGESDDSVLDDVLDVIGSAVGVIVSAAFSSDDD